MMGDGPVVVLTLIAWLLLGGCSVQFVRATVDCDQAQDVTVTVREDAEEETAVGKQKPSQSSSETAGGEAPHEN